MHGRIFLRSSPGPGTLTLSMSGPRLSSKDWCQMMPSKRSATAYVPGVQSRAQSISIFCLVRSHIMHRSSDSIAHLAAALAKAQGELVSPEKSLTATIREEG